MKKITILLFCFLAFSGFSQSKTTGVINLSSNMTANFTLNNASSKVTLVLTGPSDRWFAMGLGVLEGFGMSDGDVVVYATSLTDRNYNGFASPASDSSQDWVTVNNVVASGVRTLTLERALTNSDVNDLQLPYASTNSIDLAWARSSTVSTSLANHGGGNRGFATGSFTTLGVEDFSLNATSVYPNPSYGEFYIKTKTNLSKVNLYNQTGALVKAIKLSDDSREVKIDVNGIQSGVYFLELQNDSEKSWKKVIVN
ncbi:T9SS type A sorting domain-containing protein [Flavobacterium franklandianum]|uniref:T9SS type A sorting domain-containing protein n=1 Tax=Flavobacterium franklandianum TaxID=2594430 RepID=A0A553C6D8_9FLAO|nr:T9SS type A sorting domain-containing protein [Flavobacterium franklandianum]TRX16094.1 T9SS type A sorting domain-containing protein [Flavobacterium franklandianum]TRX23359.1 T9SS type A sorting domain-containing protein [Flavobacterium franklandianum]